MKIDVMKDYEEMSRKAADLIIEQVRTKPDSVICFPTGGTPVRMYAMLVQDFRDGKVDFSRVRVRSVDEYVGLAEDHDQSYAYFLHANLLDHANFDQKNIRLVNGKALDLQQEIADYKALLAEGVDLIIDGIGENGHIAFNEPDDRLELDLHIQAIAENTREVNARFFADPNEVPTHAISLGVRDIIHAEKVIVVSSGVKKAKVWKRFFEETFATTDFPATFLKFVKDLHLVMDMESASEIDLKCLF